MREIHASTAAPRPDRDGTAGHYIPADDLRAGVPPPWPFIVHRLRHDSDRLARYQDDAERRLARRPPVWIRQAVAVHRVWVRARGLLRVADSRHRRVVQPPDYGSGARLREP